MVPLMMKKQLMSSQTKQFLKKKVDNKYPVQLHQMMMINLNVYLFTKNMSKTS